MSGEQVYYLITYSVFLVFSIILVLGTVPDPEKKQKELAVLCIVGCICTAYCFSVVMKAIFAPSLL